MKTIVRTTAKDTKLDLNLSTVNLAAFFCLTSLTLVLTILFYCFPICVCVCINLIIIQKIRINLHKFFKRKICNVFKCVLLFYLVAFGTDQFAM